MKARAVGLRLVMPGDGTVPTDGIGSFDRWRSRLRQVLGEILNRSRLPGAIAPIQLADLVTGSRIEVSVSAVFTRLSIDGRDYYFDRITGAFDGTGQNVTLPSG